MAARKKTPTLLPDLDSVPKFITLTDRDDYVRAICVKFSFAMNNVLSPYINPEIRKIRRPRMMIGDIWEIIRSYIVPPLTHTVTLGLHGETAVADSQRVITFDETSSSAAPGTAITAFMHVMQKDINCIDDEGNAWDETFLREMGLLDTSVKSLKPNLDVGENADLKIVPYQLTTQKHKSFRCRYLTGCSKHDIALPAYNAYHTYDLCSINGEHSSISLTSGGFHTQDFDQQRFGICHNTIYACQYNEKTEIFTVYTHNGTTGAYNNTNIQYWSINGKQKNQSGYSSYDTEESPRFGLTKTNVFVDFAIGSNVLLVAYHKRVSATKYQLVIYEITVMDLQKFAHVVQRSHSIYQDHNFMKIKKVQSMPLDGCLPHIIWSRLFVISPEDSFMESFNLAAIAHPTLEELEQQEKKSPNDKQICVQLMTSNNEPTSKVIKCECYQCNRSAATSYNISRQIKCTRYMKSEPPEIPSDAQHCIFVVYDDETFAKHNVPAALETGKLINYGLLPISLRKQPPRVTRTSVIKSVNPPVFTNKSHDTDTEFIADEYSELNWNWDGEFPEDDAVQDDESPEDDIAPDTECIIEEDIEIMPDIIVTFNTYKNVLLVTK